MVGPGGVNSPGTTLTGTSQTFQWNQAANATSYLLNVRDVTTNALSNYSISSGSTTSYDLGDLTAGDSYKWNMYAYNGTTQSPISGDMYFQVSPPITTPSAPQLVGPGGVNSPGTTLTGTSQTFQWNQAANATSYLLNVRDVTTNALSNYSISSGSTTSYDLSGLTAGDRLKWNMYAYNGTTQSPISGDMYFQVSPPITTPSAPQLVGPGGVNSPGTTLTGTSQTFRWNQAANTTRYLLNVRDVTTNALSNYTISGGSTTSYNLSGLTAGDSYKWNMYAYNGTTRASSPATCTSRCPRRSQQTADPFPNPSVPTPVPGVIEAENFDTGGEGVAYHDTSLISPGNSNYRVGAGVGVETTIDGGADGLDVGCIKAGEWLEYTINVPTGGLYTVNARVASLGQGGNLHVSFDSNAQTTGSMTIPNTNGWGSWQTISPATASTVTLSAGTVSAHLVDSNGTTNYVGNLNWIKISQLDATTPSAPQLVGPTAASTALARLSPARARPSGGTRPPTPPVTCSTFATSPPTP